MIKPHAPESHDPATVFWLSLAQLITWGSVFYGFSLLLEPVERDLGLSRAEASLAFSLALLAEGLMAWPVGRLIDAGHERVVMAGGSLLVAAGLYAHSLVESLASFYGAWVILGVALSGTLYTPVFAVVTRRYPNDFRRAIIVLTFLGGLASTVFIPVTDALIRHLGWREALWVLAALQLLVCAPLHAWVLRAAPRGRTRALAAANVQGANPASARPAPSRLREHLRSRSFVALGVFIVLMMAVTSALPAHMVSLLREVGMPSAWVIAIPASIGAIQVLGRALLFFFERRFDVHLANLIIPCLIPLGLLALLGAMALGDPSWVAGGTHGADAPALGMALVLALTFVFLYGLGNGMLTIVKGTAIAQYVSQEHVATLNGALGLPLALARAAAPWLMGVLWSPSQGYVTGIVVMLLACGVAVAALRTAQVAARSKHPLRV